MLGYLLEWLIYLITVVSSLLYPLYRSTNLIKKKNQAYLHNILKYWVIYSLLYFIDSYFKVFFESIIPFYDFLLMVLYISLVFKSFALSAVLYDNVIYKIFMMNEGYIDYYLNEMNERMANSKDAAVANSKSWINNFVKTTIVPFLTKLIFQNPQEPENVEKPKTE